MWLTYKVTWGRRVWAQLLAEQLSELPLCLCEPHPGRETAVTGEGLELAGFPRQHLLTPWVPNSVTAIWRKRVSAFHGGEWRRGTQLVPPSVGKTVLFFFFFLKISCFYWCISDFQCCDSLCYTAKWLSFTHIYISFFNIRFHYGLSQEIGYSSSRCTVGVCCLFILNVIVCIYQPQTPSPSLSLPISPWQPQVWSL